jgi:hypothetical protein
MTRHALVSAPRDLRFNIEVTHVAQDSGGATVSAIDRTTRAAGDRSPPSLRPTRTCAAPWPGSWVAAVSGQRR